MEKLYSLRSAARLLGTSRPTLRRWLRDAELNTPRAAGDARRRQLSWSQLARLAARHHRVIVEPPISEGDRIAQLERQVSELLRQVEELQRDREAMDVDDPERGL